MNSLNEINIENRKYCFFGDIINIKNLHPNKFDKNQQKSRKNILN